MKLTDLNPSWMYVGPKDVPTQIDVGIEFDCPCLKCGTRCAVPFDVALDGVATPWGAKGWQRSGVTFETLTLQPSIWRVTPPHCGWHGFLTNGELTGC